MIMNRNLLTFLILIVIGSIVISCTYDEIKPKKVEVPDVVSFSVNVMPIFDGGCNVVGCHSNGGQPPNLTAPNAFVSLTYYGYVDIVEPEASIIYEKITTGTMKQYATDQDRAIILKWIQQGAEDN